MPTETSSQFDPATSALTAAVGPGQPNNGDDVITIQNSAQYRGGDQIRHGALWRCL